MFIRLCKSGKVLWDEFQADWPLNIPVDCFTANNQVLWEVILSKNVVKYQTCKPSSRNYSRSGTTGLKVWEIYINRSETRGICSWLKLLNYWSTNHCWTECRWSGVSNETNEVCTMYIEEFILVDIWIHCCTVHETGLNSIGRMLVYIHSQQRNEICENYS